MDFIECPKCKKEIQEEFEFCPYCKTKITKKEPKVNKINFNKIILCIMIISLCLNVFQAILYFSQKKAINKTNGPTQKNELVVDSKKQQLAVNEDDINKKFDVKELVWVDEYINATNYHYDLVITNNSQATYVVKYDIKYFDEANNVIGSSSGKTSPIASGQPFYVSAHLDEQEFKRAEYKITPQSSNDIAFNPSYVTAEVKSTGAKGKYTATLTNNDSYDYEFTGVNVVFYNGDKIVDVEEVYTNNSDYLLPSGETITNDFSCRKENDRIEYYVFGRYAE